jgi:kynureninase
LTRDLRDAVEARLSRFGLRVVTPPEDDRRGGHLALTHPDAGPLSRALRARGVVPDFRPPHLLRLAPSPLSTTIAECGQAVAILEEILTTRAYETLPECDDPVT